MTETSPNPKGVQFIRGLPFPDLPWFRKEKIENTLDYVPHDGDIIIAAYPKTGTTWLQYIVQQIVSKGGPPPSMDDMLYKTIPFMEMAGTEAIEALQEPRIYKHHLPFSVLKKNPKAKYLYIYRNPEDTLISYYHFMQNLMDDDLDFEQFFEGFLTGVIGYGRYFEHVLSYLSDGASDNVLLISYENLKVNTKGEVLRIAKFIGEGYFQDIREDEAVLSRIVMHTHFEYMKKNLPVVRPGNGVKMITENAPKAVNFFRKGVVGDGKEVLTSEQLKRLNKLVEELMKGTKIFDEWLAQI